MGTDGVNRVSGSFGYDIEIEGDSIVLVQFGEHDVRQVAKRLNVDPEALRAANPQIKDPTSLAVGQEIHLPKGSVPEPAPRAEPPAGNPTDAAAPMGDPLAKSAVQANLQSQSGGISGLGEK